MRINKLNSSCGYNNIPKDRDINKSSNQKAPTTDRVIISKQPEEEQIKAKIKDNILKIQNKSCSKENLDEIKKKISENRYFIDTNDIVKAML